MAAVGGRGRAIERIWIVEMPESRVKDPVVAAGIFLCALAVFWSFRALGWFAQDEGVLYYHYLRTHRGQLPYRDFFTGYGPITLYLHSLLFSVFGVSLDATRIYMALLNSTAAVMLFLVTRRIASWHFAVIPPLLFVTMQPGDISDMAFHNTPYPLWYLVLFFSFAAWALLKSVEATSVRARAAWMFVVGFMGGIALLTKQNGGVFLLWAATGFVASYPMCEGDTKEGWPWRFARIAYLFLMPLSMLALSWTFTSPLTLGAYVLPLVGLAWVGAMRVFSRQATLLALRSAGWMTLGGLVATVPWVVYFAAQIGLVGFVEALFFWGKYVDRMIFLAYPMPGKLAVFILCAVLIPWLCVVLVERHGWRDAPRWSRAIIVSLWMLFLGATVAFLSYHWIEVRHVLLMRYNPWLIYRESSMALDMTVAFLAFPILAGAILLLARQARGELRDGDPPPAAFLCVCWMGMCCYLLYYPRMDAAHFVSAAVLLYAIGAALLEVAGHRLAGLSQVYGVRYRLAAFAAAALFLIFAANLKLAPKVYSVVMLRKEGTGFPLVETPTEKYSFDRLNVYFPIYEKTHRQTHRSFLEAVDYLREQTTDGEPIFAFPAFPMIYFAAERDNPTRHDYFLSNNVPYDEQLRLVRQIEESDVRVLVVPSDENDYFVEVGRPYHTFLWAYFRQEFYLEKRFGLYQIWRRFDAPDAVARS